MPKHTTSTSELSIVYAEQGRWDIGDGQGSDAGWYVVEPDYPQEPLGPFETRYEAESELISILFDRAPKDPLAE